jgi:hypothetical protein
VEDTAYPICLVVPTPDGVGPARNVTRREESGHAGFEIGVHDHSAVGRCTEVAGAAAAPQ